MRKIVVLSVKKPSSAGGAEIVWRNLKKRGLKFRNVSLDEKKMPYLYKKIPNVFHLKEIFSSKWLMKESISKNPDILIYDKIFGWPRLNSESKKICYNHGSYTLAGLAFKRKNIFVYLFYKYILKCFEKKSYKNADKVIAVSESVRNEMINYFNISSNKIRVINNSVNLKKFSPIKNKTNIKNKYKIPKEKKIIFFPGRPSFGKGFDIAKKVLDKLDDNYFMFCLGEGKDIPGKIRFIGKVSNDRMPEVYNMADLCLFPSRYEGSSVSVLESAACGVPLVLSEAGLMKTESSMKDFVCHSVKEYVEKIINLNFELSSKNWRDFSKNFSLEKQMSELEEFIENEK